MVLLHRSLQGDSKTSRFAILQIFYELILNFKDHNKLLQTSPCWHYSYESLSTQITPWGFSNSNTDVPGRVREGRRGLTGRFPARGSPAARVEGCGSFTGSRRTPGWSWGAGRGSEAAARRSRRVGGGVLRRLGLSGGRGWKIRG